MKRKNIRVKRSQNTRDLCLGKIVIVCEGDTEEAYFSLLRKHLNEDIHNRVEIKTINVLGGDARAVWREAKRHLQDSQDAQKYVYHDKYVVFDCDAPDDIENVIKEVEKNDICTLTVSNPCFDLWILLHFTTAAKINSKAKLKEALEKQFKGQYHKGEWAAKQVFSAEQYDRNIQSAIARAKDLAKKYDRNDYILCRDIKKMSPYTNVHELVEKLLQAIKKPN